jgi:hypothetical protein
MSNKNKNKNFDILDKILSDANIPARQGDQQWVVDPNHPDGGYMINSQEDYEQLVKSANDIEKYLRS